MRSASICLDLILRPVSSAISLGSRNVALIVILSLYSVAASAGEILTAFAGLAGNPVPPPKSIPALFGAAVESAPNPSQPLPAPAIDLYTPLSYAAALSLAAHFFERASRSATSSGRKRSIFSSISMCFGVSFLAADFLTSSHARATAAS